MPMLARAPRAHTLARQGIGDKHGLAVHPRHPAPVVGKIVDVGIK
jgi:hypothetical protein